VEGVGAGLLVLDSFRHRYICGECPLPCANLTVFFLQVIAVLPIFFIAIGLVFRSAIRGQIIPMIRSYFFAPTKIRGLFLFAEFRDKMTIQFSL